MSDGAAELARAIEMAAHQCPPEEIAAELGHMTGWDEERVHSWLARFAGVLTQARLRERAAMRMQIWRCARGTAGAEEMSRVRWEMACELMRQHAGWSRAAPMDELMRFFLAAEKQRDKHGGKAGLKVAG